MKTFIYARPVQAALIAAAIGGASTAAIADIKDYKFELVDQTVQAGPDKVITVRLMNTRTGKPVPDAVIFASRLDMAPDGMQEMVTKIAPMPAGEPGTVETKYPPSARSTSCVIRCKRLLHTTMVLRLRIVLLTRRVTGTLKLSRSMTSGFPI